MPGETINAPNKHTPGYNEASSGTSTPGTPYTISNRNLARQAEMEFWGPKWSTAMHLVPSLRWRGREKNASLGECHQGAWSSVGKKGKIWHNILFHLLNIWTFLVTQHKYMSKWVQKFFDSGLNCWLKLICKTLPIVTALFPLGEHAPWTEIVSKTQQF